MLMNLLLCQIYHILQRILKDFKILVNFEENIIGKTLRTVPTNSKVFFPRFMIMQKM